MTPAEHDEACAVVSHLPHLFSSVYLEAFFADRKDWVVLGGASFRDWVRIAGACPEIWVDIFWTNRKRVLAHVFRFQEKLQEIVSFLQEKDPEKLQAFLAEVFRLKEDLQR